MSSIREVKKLLKIWTKLALNMRMRDRMVKVIQYGCQMILGYYAMRLSHPIQQGLAETRRFASNARKAFWLLKSFNHLDTCFQMFENGVLQTEYIADKFDFLEQISLMAYFFSENLIFFIRSKILPMKEESIDGWSNLTWFLADLSAFVSSCLRLHHNHQLLLESRNSIAYNQDIMPYQPTFSISTKSGPSVLVENTQNLKDKEFQLLLCTAINMFELGVSCHYMKIYKQIFGKDISEGHVGLMGVVSSMLILYEGYISVSKEVYSQFNSGTSSKSQIDNTSQHDLGKEDELEEKEGDTDKEGETESDECYGLNKVDDTPDHIII
jgi:hypothetical protein